ncbi:MAG: carbohydrate ABC transporter permease [Planctomycetota bacterium]|nr:carbohydrate ABC transporter permease [Planctomycetota bacterium]
MTGPGTLRRLGAHATLVVLSFAFVMPFAWLVTTSLQSGSEQARATPAFLPGPAALGQKVEDATGMHLVYQPTLEHYEKGLTRVPILMFFRNTLLVCTLTVLGTCLSSSLVAYGFGVLRWRGRNAIFFLMLATMMLPGQVTMIPVFTIWRRLGLVDTYAPLVIPAFLGTPFYVFLFRQFFLTVPRELIEAARVDGASELRIWSRLVMPLSLPVIATVALFSFLGAWNDFLGPLIYLADESKYTLSLGLAMYRTQYGSEYGQMMAVATLMVVPILVLFFFTQKTFIQGIKTTGLKG